MATVDTRTTRRSLPSLESPSRWVVVVLLAGVQSLDSADRSTLSAVEDQLETQLGIGPAGFGLLASASALLGLVATFPVGMMVDRITRTRLLAVCTGVWALAEVGCALAPSYAVLLVARLFLGAVLASVPAVVSLTGDWFLVGERARIFGLVLAGELVGTALGFVVVGQIGIALGWRWAFALLAVVGVVMALTLARLGEPARGAQLRRESGYPGGTTRKDDLEQEVEREHVPAPARLVLRTDPTTMSAGRVLRYVVSVRSNVVLIVASGCGYLFLSGVQTFAFSFATDHLGLRGFALTAGLLGVGLGAVVGVLGTGRVADRLVRRGRVSGRPMVAAATFVVAVVCFVPGVLVTTLWVALPLLVVGAVALGGTNPPLDSARLDVVHHGAWGRAEGLRSTVRLVGYAVAPSLTGLLAASFGIGPAFALLTAALLLAAVMLFAGLRWYPADVAAAAATEKRVADAGT